MRFLLTVSIGLLSIVTSTVASAAQEISLDARDADMAEVAGSIAKQANIAIIIPAHATYTVKQLHLDKAPLEVALAQLSQATGLTVTKVEPTTYILGQQPSDVPRWTFTPAEAKPYTIAMRLDDTFTQEIQIQGHDSFSVSTT